VYCVCVRVCACARACLVMTHALVSPGNSSMRVCVLEWAEPTFVGVPGLVELVEGISNVVC
jgi:hypothetical protein